jgi:hypothetical protein
MRKIRRIRETQSGMVTEDVFPAIPENACAITHKSSQYCVPQLTGANHDVYIYDCKSCFIDLRHIQVAAIHLRTLENCVVICGNAEGSLLGHSVNHSLLILGCKQVSCICNLVGRSVKANERNGNKFRIHDSHHLRVHLQIPSHPIIEDCSDMTFGPYPSLLIEGNQDFWIDSKFNYVEDFNWHKKTASPNWRLCEDLSASFLTHLVTKKNLKDGQPLSTEELKRFLEIVN